MNNIIHYELDCVEDVCALPDWKLPRAFTGLRHVQKIEGFEPSVEQSWRMKERVR